MKRLLLLFPALFLLSSCSLEELRDDFRPSSHKAFSIEEAKEFFEKDYTEQLTRAEAAGMNERKFRSKLHSGDFTPLWDKAAYSESDGVAAYDVDILADRSIIAIRSKFGPNGAKAERLKVHQKLVVRRDVKTGAMASYVLSLIPDVGCDDRRIPEKFRSRGEKGGFSGIAVYTTPGRGALVRVQEYKDGALKRGVYIPYGESPYWDRCLKAKDILSGMALLSRRNIATKSGEDYTDEDKELHDQYYLGDALELGLEDLGNGVYRDNDGRYYLDDDDDGYIDYEIIAPSETVGEKGEGEEDPPPITGGDGGGGGNTEGGGAVEDENITIPQGPTHLPDVTNLFNIGQHFTKYTDADKNCLDVCKRIMDKMGQTNYGSSANVIYLVRENDDHTALIHYGEAAQYYSTVTDCINRHLDAGLCIIAGVNHTLESKINDGTIDHFILIVGREHSEISGKYEYLYVETGTDYPNTAYNPDNRLVYDELSDMFIDDSTPKANKAYTLTELRPNDGNNSGTIVQPAKRMFRLFNFIRL